jgi:arsenate reductase (thioredoxin)
MTGQLPRALFVCIENAGRSQVAQAFWERAGGDARSAGSHPGEALQPEVITVMRERGIDLADRVPRGLTREDAEWAQLVVTLGCGDACPYIPGKTYSDWQLPDPHGHSLDEIRAVRDEIERRIDDLAGRYTREPRA